MPSTDIFEFRQVLAKSKKIIIISGAGLSVASGISTFRGNGGRYEKYNPSELATPTAFSEDQSRVWQYYHHRREDMQDKRPNMAHYTLARLAIPNIRHTIAPGSILTHITQNIDTLSDSEIIEMHGRIFDVICTAHDCSYQATDPTSPICPALAGTEAKVNQGDFSTSIKRKDLPRCPQCTQLLRPDVVWFGEKPKRIHEILDLAKQADLCLVVGTSAVVQPASKVSGIVKEHGGKVAIFNVEEINHSNEADFMFLGPCETMLGEVLGV